MLNNKRVLIWSFLILSSSSLPAVAARSGENEPGRQLLDSFLPAELASRYQSEPCHGRFTSSCTLWTAGWNEARYLVLKASKTGRRPAAEALIQEVAPPTNLPEDFTFRPVPKRSADDPDTYLVQRSAGTGKVQITVSDWVLVTWMPDLSGVGAFETVQASIVDAPKVREIRELSVPGSADLIGEDSAGSLFFSAWENEIYRLEPATDQVTPMTGGTARGTPDGMIVDSRDQIWFGGYNGRYLGLIDTAGTLSQFPMPYNPSSPAIPCEAPDGHIWITDHPQNRITEFNPQEGAFGRSIPMPVGNVWVTQCTAEPGANVLWMTWYLGQSLARLDLATATIQRFPVPCSPAFLTFDATGAIWAGCWNNGNVIQFDTKTLTGRMFVIPGGGQVGGIAVDLRGKIVFAQNTVGRIGVLDPNSAQVYAFQLPTRPQFKDSVFVDSGGILWAPSPSRRLIGKIVQ